LFVADGFDDRAASGRGSNWRMGRRHAGRQTMLTDN
jgi:hypothetical protein